MERIRYTTRSFMGLNVFSVKRAWFLCFYILCSLTTVVSALEPAKNPPEAEVSNIKKPKVDSPLAGFPAVTFFLCFPSSSLELSKKMEKVTSKHLEKFWKVVPKPLPGLNKGSDINEGKFLQNPFLTYEIEDLKDIAGKKLPIVKASLSFAAPLSAETNESSSRVVVWNRHCYIQSNLEKQLEKSTLETLDFLMSEFQRDYQTANRTASNKPTLYFAE